MYKRYYLNSEKTNIKRVSQLLSRNRKDIIDLETEEKDTKRGAEGIVSPSFLMTGASRCHQNFGNKKGYTLQTRS